MAVKSKRAERGMTGKVCLYRGKVRHPRNYTMTPNDHVQTDQHLQRTGLSRGDFFTSLQRKFGHLITATEVVPLPKLRASARALPVSTPSTATTLTA